MNLKTQENIRKIEIGVIIGTNVLSILLQKYSNNSLTQETIQFLENNKINIEEIVNITTHLYEIDVLTSFRTQKLTVEYKKFEKLYHQILYNTSMLYKNLELDDPTSIFATYVYMYRNGYFSNEHHFEYSTNLKDYSKLLGLDVIRGSGVCRSIAGMLTDIYRELNMNSYDLSVNASGDAIRNLENSCNTELSKNDDSKKFVKFVSLLTKYIPIGNHLVTTVEKDGMNYIFDPTNDGFLQKGNGNHLLVANNPKYYMKRTYISDFVSGILRQNNTRINYLDAKKQLNLPTISENEYREIYLKTLKQCKENIDILEKFYIKNKEIYYEISKETEKQSNLIKRLIPTIPNINTKK